MSWFGLVSSDKNTNVLEHAQITLKIRQIFFNTFEKDLFKKLNSFQKSE